MIPKKISFAGFTRIDTDWQEEDEEVTPWKIHKASLEEDDEPQLSLEEEEIKWIQFYLLIPYYTEAARMLEGNWHMQFDELIAKFPNYKVEGRVQDIADGLALFCKDNTNGEVFCILNKWDCTT